MNMNKLCYCSYQDKCKWTHLVGKTGATEGKEHHCAVMDEMHSASTILMIFSAGSLGIKKQLSLGGMFLSSTSH